MAATVVLRLSRDQLYAGVRCAYRRHPALVFLQPFDGKTVLFVEASSC